MPETYNVLLGDDARFQNRDIIGAVEDDKVFARENPAQFAGDLNKLMMLLELIGY